MSEKNKYSDTSSGIVAGGGGAERLTIAATVAQGSDLPCRKVYIQATVSNTGSVRLNIEVAATTILGIQLPEAEEAENGGILELAIDNVNKLFFFGTNDDTVDIMYLR